MKRVTPIAISTFATLCLLLPQSASAQQRRVFRPLDAGVVAPTTPAPVPVPVPVDAGTTGDAGVKEKGKEGPEQKKRRKDYIEHIRKEIRAIVPAHQLTDPDRDLVRAHWRRAMRTLRVRVLAEDAADAASVARCDAVLARIDQHLFDKLKELHKKSGTPAKDGGAK